MGNLPENRVTANRPFLNTGVDFCGPIQIHYKLRGKRPTKAYIAVFCCFSTKAIHLELVSDLTTDAFIGSLNRFPSRRGRCENIYCDNATNFVGAKNQLLELKDAVFENKSKERIYTYCSQKGIEFHFIPLRATHFGGLWEAAVKSAKHLLVKSVGYVSLTYEELETVIVQIEGILNSRPLTPMSSDPNDLAALTPGHFLIGEPITTQPSKSTGEDRASTLQRWRLVSHLKDQFWDRWSNEYLNELQQRKKWKTPCSNIEPGTMVIIKEDNAPPLRWPLGRIIKTFKGEDGLVRVAEVKTATGTLKRAIHRLAPLFPEEQNQIPVISGKPNTEETNTANKRRKFNCSLYLATVIAFIMCLPLLMCKSVKITNFDNQPGIYFENMGRLHPMSSHWNLVIYYNLLPLKTELAMMNKGITILKQTCSKLHHEICDDLLPQFIQIASELEVDERLLSPTRVKRGAVNIVGNIANSLFGVLDSEYAEAMSKSINEIGNNEQYLLVLLKNQTSIIDSTVNVMKNNQEKAKTKFDSIDKTVDNLRNAIISDDKKINQHNMLLALISLTIHLIITTSKQRTQAMILNVLTDVHHGQVVPLLLSPQQLKNEINKIKTHLPPTMQLPVQEDDLIGIYKLMSVQGGLAPAHVLFKATIPLIGIPEFNLYKIHPIAAKSKNVMIAIQPTTEFIAITAHGDIYFPMTQQQVKSCIMLKEHAHLCQLQQHPIHHKGSISNSCEIGFFNNDTKLSCEVADVPSEHWIQLNDKNQWMFALNHPKKFTAVYGTDTNQFTVDGAGILELQPECTIKHDQFMLVGHYDISSSIIPSITTHNSWSQLHDPKTSEPVMLKKTLTPFDPELKELLALQNALKEQQLLLLPHDIQNTNYHMFGVGYTSLVLLILAVLYTVLGHITFKSNKLEVTYYF